MHDLISSFTLVFAAEIGDKTQLLSAILAARYRKFWPIFLGITVATLANHTLAAYVGSLLAGHIDFALLNKVTSGIFIVLGIWMLIPDKAPETEQTEPKCGVFLASFFAFFIAEMGDKTQIATLTLGAESPHLAMVIAGTTLGMMVANAPAIMFGERLLKIIPLKEVRIVASVLFIGYGLYSFA